MASTHATAQGTARLAARYPAAGAKQFFRRAQEWTVSSLGLGSYLGNIDDATDRGYEASVEAAVRGGINFIDTSLNYRHQSSERNIGAALERLFASGAAARDEVVVATKAGYLVPGAVPAALEPHDVVGRMHAMSPAFLADQLSRSLVNLRLACVDVLYLHNPETQLQYVPGEEFYRRIRTAFEELERQAAEGRLRYYGAATWQGFRTNGPDTGLSLRRMHSIAREVGGEDHRFRFIQLPFNLAMTEGLAALDEATDLGITAVASASILQGRLSRDLPEQIGEQFPGANTDAVRSIQFTRSSRGVTAALVGMSTPAHVEENLAVAGLEPADLAAWFRPRPS